MALEMNRKCGLLRMKNMYYRKQRWRRNAKYKQKQSKWRILFVCIFETRWLRNKCWEGEETNDDEWFDEESVPVCYLCAVWRQKSPTETTIKINHPKSVYIFGFFFLVAPWCLKFYQNVHCFVLANWEMDPDEWSVMSGPGNLCEKWMTRKMFKLNDNWIVEIWKCGPKSALMEI